MDFRKHFFIFLIMLLGLPNIGMGQVDYFKRNGELNYNITLVKGDNLHNFQYCERVVNDSIIRMSPDSVVEYGFDDGRVFVSRDIVVNDSGIIAKVFLQRLVDGETRLYYYKGDPLKQGKIRKLFFIEGENIGFQKLDKTSKVNKGFRDQLKSAASNCDISEQWIRKTNFTKGSLSKWFNINNLCQPVYFPKVKINVFSGLKISSFKIQNGSNSNSTSLIINADFNTNFAFYYGALIDIPIFTTPFSLGTGIGFYQTAVSASLKAGNIEYEFIINQSTFQVPVILRYMNSNPKTRPFFNIGFSYSNNFRNESLMQTSIVNNTIVSDFETIPIQLVSDVQWGLIFGVGVQHQITKRNALFMEARYTTEKSDGVDQFINKTGLEITVGVNF